MNDAISERFTACAVEMLNVEADKITPDATFAGDLGADSLDLVEFVMRLEEEFDVTIEEDELKDVRTVGRALDLVRSKLGSTL